MRLWIQSPALPKERWGEGGEEGGRKEGDACLGREKAPSSMSYQERNIFDRNTAANSLFHLIGQNYHMSTPGQEAGPLPPQDPPRDTWASLMLGWQGRKEVISHEHSGTASSLI